MIDCLGGAGVVDAAAVGLRSSSRLLEGYRYGGGRMRFTAIRSLQ
jgi:hypothetical protein